MYPKIDFKMYEDDFDKLLQTKTTQMSLLVNWKQKPENLNCRSEHTSFLNVKIIFNFYIISGFREAFIFHIAKDEEAAVEGEEMAEAGDAEFSSDMKLLKQHMIATGGFQKWNCKMEK